MITCFHFRCRFRDEELSVDICFSVSVVIVDRKAAFVIDSCDASCERNAAFLPMCADSIANCELSLAANVCGRLRRFIENVSKGEAESSWLLLIDLDTMLCW